MKICSNRSLLVLSNHPCIWTGVRKSSYNSFYLLVLELVSEVHPHDLGGRLNLEFPFHLENEKYIAQQTPFSLGPGLQSSTHKTPTNKARIYPSQIKKLHNNTPCGFTFC